MCLDGEMPLIIMPFMMNGTVLDHVRKVKDKDLEVSIIIQGAYKIAFKY